MNKLLKTSPDKLFWGSKEIAEFAGISISTAYKFKKKIQDQFNFDTSKCLKGKVPKKYVIMFFDNL